MIKENYRTAVLKYLGDITVEPCQADNLKKIRPDFVTVFSADMLSRVRELELVYCEFGITEEMILDDLRSNPYPICILECEQAVASLFLEYSAGKSLEVPQKAALLWVLWSVMYRWPLKDLRKLLPKGMPNRKQLRVACLQASRVYAGASA